MKFALVCLLASQALAAPSSSEEDIDMRASSSSEEDIDMRAFSSSEEDIGMRNFSSYEEEIDMRAFSSSEEEMDMRAATCKCGVKGSANRIVGGVEAKVNEFPWIASLILIIDGSETDSMCGGTLVSAEWIVTAAHCLYKDNDYKILYKPSEMVWTLGEHDFLDTTETKIPTIRAKVEKIIVSPEWDSMSTIGDIALIKLAKPVDLKKYTPACMAKTGQSFVGKSAWVYGWGQTSFKAEWD